MNVEIIHDDFNISVSKSMMAHSLWLVIWKPEKSALSVRPFVKRQKIKKKKNKNGAITAASLFASLDPVECGISNDFGKNHIKNWFICILCKSDLFGNTEILASDYIIWLYGIYFKF